MSGALTGTAPMLRAALDYAARGFGVIPVGPDKRPLILWKAFQLHRAGEAEIRTWWARWPEAGPALVCGAVSGRVVVDGDPRNGEGLARIADRLPPTPTVETGGGGRHHYFLAPPWAVAKMAGLLPGLDLQAEASYVVAPPSRHPSGRRYGWLPGRTLEDLPCAPLPSVIRALLALRQPPETLAEPSRGRRGAGSALRLPAVLSRVGEARRSGTGWLAHCPGHEDREPSLSIGEGADGRLLLYCFAGCTFRDVVHALYEGRP